MVHKYLFRRHETFYFRWRIPFELIPVFGLFEIRCSMNTTEQSVAFARASKLLEIVSAVKRAKTAYRHSELDIQEYLGEVQVMASKTKKPRNRDYDAEINYHHRDNSITRINFDGDLEKEMEAYKRIREMDMAANPVSNPSPAKLSPVKPSGKLMSELFDDFIKYKIEEEKLSESMQKAYQLYIKTLIEIMGDRDVVDIKKTDIRDVLKDYKTLPRRNLKKYKNLPVSELLEMEIPEEDFLADKSVHDVRKFLQGLFSFAVEKEIIENSPVRDLKLDLNKKITYANFSDSEIKKILQEVSSHTQIWRKWTCWLAAYTGARRTEIVQLRKEDIKVDEKTGRAYILITDEAGSLKTENAKRQVPIHQKLIDEGFLDFVKECEGPKIFPLLDPETVTKWFSPFRESLGIPHHNDFGERKVFHSFRHSFITNSRDANNPVDKVQQVVGHEKTHSGQTDKYSHRYELISVLDVVDKVSYG